MKPIKDSSLFYLLVILLLGAGIRFLLLLTPFMDSDQAVNGLMARHILKGALPQLYYGQDYCGSIQTYFISTIFFLFGVSRFTLDLSIFFESLFFILLIYYLAKLIFDKSTALLSALFSALGSYFLIFHSVLARSAYLEIPIIGVVLFIFTFKILSSIERKGRYFFGLGLFCGLGIWTHYLIIFYFPAIFLLLFIQDKWFWLRRTLPFFLLGLLFGGLPLWVHNIYHPLISWNYLWEGAGGGEPFLSSLVDYFSNRLPELLGVINNETQKYNIPFFSFLIYLVFGGCLFSLFLIRGKNLFNLLKFRIDHNPGLDLLLLFFLFFPFIFALSGFDSAHTSRYLQPLFSVLPILFAVFTQRLYRSSAVLALLFVILTLFSNLYGLIPRVPLFDKNQWKQFQANKKNDQDLFKYLQDKKIRRLYCHDYWVSARLTFDSQEEIIFASPVHDRYPPHTESVDRDPGAAFLFPGDNKDFEATLKNIGGTFQKSQVSGYSIYHTFTPPPLRFVEFSPTNLKATADSPLEGTRNIFDKDLATRWSSNTPQKPGLVFQVDLGETVSDLGRITLLSGTPEEGPRGLRLEISTDGRKWQTVREATGLWNDLFWSGPHPFYRPGLGRVDISFSPRTGRFLRFTQLGSDPIYYWSVAECYVYQSQPETHQPSEDLTFLISRLKGFKASDIRTTPWIQSHLPPVWGTPRERLQNEKGNLVQTISNPVFVVEKEKASTLSHFLKNTLKFPYQEQEISGHMAYFFYPAFDRYRPISSTSWRFHSNFNLQKAHLAADGKLSTRWTTGRPQTPGAYFQIDLGKLDKVARIRVLAGDSVNDFPRGYSIRYSADGQAWTSWNSNMSPVSLYWTGETLLKNGRDLDFTFPSTPMRYLQIVNTGKDEVYYWSIHEIEIFTRQNN